MDFKELSERLFLEESEYRDLIGLFIETSIYDLKVFKSAVQAKDAEQASRAIHSIKGAADNLGLLELHEMVKNIEMDISNNQFQNISESSRMLQKKLGVIEELLLREET